MNTRIRILCWALLLCSTAVQAALIDSSEARRRAICFLQEGRGAQARRLAPTAGETALSLELDGGQYFVFGIDKAKGFVIVGGTGDILGYSDEATFRTDGLPANVRAWLDGYADEIRWMECHDILPTEDRLQATSRRAVQSMVKHAVSPLLTCRWNQGSPYNTQCPMDGTSRSVTGCVATAMAQVLYYHRTENRSTLSATSAYTKSSKTVAALPTTTIDWSQLIDDYSGSYTTTQQQAVATLMQYAGAAVEMDYSSSLSSAYAEDIPAALSGCFGYDADVAVATRNNYLYDDWVDVVYRELTENGPVLYTGQSAGGGHAFVVDGYEEDDYFHVNWGWGGTANGWFRLSVMNPYDQGIGGSTSKSGFDFMQDIIVNVHPQNNGVSESVPATTAGSGTLSVVSGSWKLGGNGTAVMGYPTTVIVKVKNTGNEDYDGDLRLGALPVSSQSFFGNTFFLPTGEAGIFLASCWLHLAAGDTKEVSYTFTPAVAKLYAIAPLDKSVDLSNLSGTSILSLLGNYTTLNISSGGSSNQLSVNSAPAIINEKPSSSAFYGTALRLSFTLQNSGAVTYNDGVLVRLSGGGTTMNCPLSSNIAAGGTQTFEALFTGLTTGAAYTVRLCYGGGSLIAQYGPYTCQAGITTYDANGIPTASAPATALAVGNDALAVDLTGSGVTMVTPGGNPNTLYFLGSGDAVPDGLDGCNIVKDGMIETLSLTDGHDFYTPMTFTAGEVTYTRRFTTGADGKKGWTTLVLPFDVTEVRCGNRQIDWFHSASDRGKHFWVKTFSGEGSGSVLFDYATEMTVGTPYIVAVPGSKWGEDWDLTDKDIIFVGPQNTEVIAGQTCCVTGRQLKFVGSLRTTAVTDVYTTNTDGTAFVKTSADSAPFRAYFQPFSYLPLSVLAIGSADSKTTDIDETVSEPLETDDTEVYDLYGRRMEKGTKGVYVIKSARGHMHGKNSKKYLK